MTSSAPAKQTVSIAVCGLHMSNQPLNYQLTGELHRKGPACCLMPVILPANLCCHRSS